MKMWVDDQGHVVADSTRTPDARTADQLQRRGPSPTLTDGSTGPLFRIRCTFCKVDSTRHATEAVAWIIEHHNLHLDLP